MAIKRDRPASATAQPRLSIVLIAHRMQEQVLNTIHSLSAAYQQGADPAAYEVIVVENRSDQMLSDEDVAGLPENFIYHSHDDGSVSPVAALRFAQSVCRGESIGVIIDGAQMLTPRVIAPALEILASDDRALIVVPGYHLGTTMHHEVIGCRELIEQQRHFLQTSGWRENGYRLLDWACFSPGNSKGFLQPLMEASVLFCARDRFLAANCADERFNLPGGGSLNLHIYRTLGLQAESRLYLLPGEATLHQYHGGVTTHPSGELEKKLARFNAQLQDIWGGRFFALRREPILVGPVGRHAEPFLAESVRLAKRRFDRLDALGRRHWEDDPVAVEAKPPAEAPVTTLPQGNHRPRLSIVCVVYDVPRQFSNTLRTLSPAYQNPGPNLSEAAGTDYEVVIVENPSPHTLSDDLLSSFPGDLQYHLNDRPSVSPAAALNRAVEMARGEFVGILIDSAYMLSPGILSRAAALLDINPNAIISVPGYHLGSERQEQSSQHGYDEAAEERLLATRDWPRDGYELFELACFSGANPHGVLHPAMESHLLFCPKQAFLDCGGANTAFVSTGGGSVNMDLYRQLLMATDFPLRILWGEGVFHQFHGGVTTSYRNTLEEDLALFQDEYRRIRGHDYSAVLKEPSFYGPLRQPVLPFIDYSCEQGAKRYARFAREKRPAWSDDNNYNL